MHPIYCDVDFIQAGKIITTGEEDFISAMEEEGVRWSRCSEADIRWQQAVLGERADCVDTKRRDGGSMNDRLTVFILNGARDGKELALCAMEGQWMRDGGALKTDTL